MYSTARQLSSDVCCGEILTLSEFFKIKKTLPLPGQGLLEPRSEVCFVPYLSPFSLSAKGGFSVFIETTVFLCDRFSVTFVPLMGRKIDSSPERCCVLFSSPPDLLRQGMISDSSPERCCVSFFTAADPGDSAQF